jgi:hypothetical protein
MLLWTVLLNPENFAIVVLVLKDMSVLLSFQPHVLEVEQDWLSSITSLQNSLHLFSIRQMTGVEESIGWAFLIVKVRFPFGVWEVLEILVNDKIFSFLFGVL